MKSIGGLCAFPPEKRSQRPENCVLKGAEWPVSPTGVIGCAIGMLFGSLTHLGATTYGVTGIPGLLAINNIPIYCVELLISAGVALLVTTVIWKEDPPKPAVSVIRCANGAVLPIHVGVDTVAMNGDGFDCPVKAGDKVKAGQPLIRFSRDKIKAAGYSDTVAVLLTNSDDLSGVEYGAK